MGVNGEPQINRRTWVLCGLLGVLVLGAYGVHVAGYWNQINDDAYITFRYARNLAAGMGPYYNPGERVEGFTNPLLMLQLSAAIALLGPDAVADVARWIGALSGVLCILGAWWLCLRGLQTIATLQAAAPLVAWLAGALVATNAAFALNSTSGLETVQYGALLTLAMAVLSQEARQGRFLGSAILLGLAVWSRPEGLLVVAVALLVQFLVAGRLRRPALLGVLLVGASAAVLFALRWTLFDGEWLPNTYYAKRGGVAGQGAGSYLGEYTWLHLGGPAILLAVVPLLMGGRERRRVLAPGAAIVVAGGLVCALVGADWMLGFRFLVPYTPLWSMLAICGLAIVAARVVGAPAALTTLLGLLLVGGIWLGQSQVRATRYLPWVTTRAAGYLAGHQALADWLRVTALPGDTVALMDIGIVGYRCPSLRIRDITGLTDRAIARAPGGFLDKQFPAAEVLDREPAFVVIVLTAPQLPGAQGPVFDPAELTCWTRLEERIVEDAAFRRHYVRLRQAADDEPLGRVAGMIGAERIFSHAYPGRFYFLAVYRFHSAETE